MTVFLSAVRTPFGAFGGALKDFTATDLAVHAARAAIERAQVPAAAVDTTVFGNVLQTSADACYYARHIALRAGCRIETPSLTVNRLCGSGFEAIVQGVNAITSGEAEVALVGGGESMSQAPFAARNIRWGIGLGVNPPLVDTLTEALRDAYAGCAMAETAENLADRYKLTRRDVDEFALRSQQLARDGWASGAYDDEVVAVSVQRPKAKTAESFARDEHMRPDSTAEGLAKLRALFRENGTVTAGNASGIGDGAGALVLASENAARKHGAKPLARFVSSAVVGVDPTVMGIGPVPAAKLALDRAGMTLAQMDLIEINEAFASQTVAVERELGIPREKLNVHGGAIALSHPLAASGARITAHLIHSLRHSGKRFGLGAACIGGGQGIAVIVEIAH
ncbi:MAG TPA: thiolase family protein [Gemmatimonadaceae bacterium]|nr:thiolase family protein [Gemmatimonadaceae bacterium]